VFLKNSSRLMIVVTKANTQIVSRRDNGQLTKGCSPINYHNSIKIHYIYNLLCCQKKIHDYSLITALHIRYNRAAFTVHNYKINPRKKSFIGCTELATNIRFVKAVRPGLRAHSDKNVQRLSVISALKDSFGITHYFLRLYKYFSKM